MKGDDIVDRLIDFSVRVIALAEALPDTRSGKHICGQLLRCGTSPGANYEEARGAESRADFVHKLGIAWKELRESTYWIRVIQKARMVKPELVAGLLPEAIELSCILAASISTAKSRDIAPLKQPPEP
jgi:four helix bundle protein